MKVFITGGSGFIGSHLSRFFIEQGHNVVVLDNFLTGSRDNVADLLGSPHFSLIEGDVRAFDFFTLSSFDLVYHLASPASPIQYKKYPLETLMTNSLGTQRLLAFVRDKGGVFVLASTSEVYGDPLVHPQIESYYGNVNSFGPRSCYDEGKRFSEAVTYTYIHRYGVDARIARIFNTYGPFMDRHDGRVVSNFIVQALSGQDITLYGDGMQTRSFCYVSDLVNGLVAMGIRGNLSGQVVNLGNPVERTVSDLAKLVIRLTGSPSRVVQLPIDQDDPTRRKPDITKALQLLNWQPKVNLEEGLKDSIDYFKS